MLIFCETVYGQEGTLQPRCWLPGQLTIVSYHRFFFFFSFLASYIHQLTPPSEAALKSLFSEGRKAIYVSYHFLNFD